MEYLPSFRDQIQNGSTYTWRDDLANGLYHHGIKGMHWGVRRPRNEDGILQGAGKSLFKKMKQHRQKRKDAKLEKLKRRRNVYGALEGANRVARKSRSKQKTALGKAIVTIATPGLAINEKYYGHRRKVMNKKIDRLSN